MLENRIGNKMDLQQFQKDAIRTESRIAAVSVNTKYLASLLQVMICSGNLLDQIKKNVFYDKPIDPEVRATYLTGIIEALDTKELFIDDPTVDKTTIEVSPRLFHSIIGMATESTELLENMADGNIDVVNLLEEIGDLHWYAAIAFDETGANWDDTLDTTIKKLKSRYPDAYSADNAINRDLATERAILEENSLNGENTTK